jgi:hypothetical protein
VVPAAHEAIDEDVSSADDESSDDEEVMQQE